MPITTHVTCLRCRGRGYLPTTATIPLMLGVACPDCQGQGSVPVTR